jgi:DNA-directed RNA polymerase specialized sigma24 family protein
LVELVRRSLEVDDVAPGDDPRRADAQELRDFVRRAAALPYRVREVAALCLDEGLSLTACGERLGIKRETVRVHLRRLRALRRRAAARG